MTTDIRKIKRQHLNAKCLILMAKFARTLHRVDGTALRLQDSNIIEQIAHHCDHSDNSELHTIYTHLRLEILKVVCRSPNGNSLISFPKQQKNDDLQAL